MVMLRGLDEGDVSPPTSDEELESDPAETGELKHEALFRELMTECRHAAVGTLLSGRLRAELEQLCPEVRRGLVSHTQQGCAPLFVAVRRGSLPLVEYLLHVCSAPHDQRGRYGRHHVTPLWAAAVDGQLPLVRALADAGADIDAGSDSGSSPARSACFVARYEIVHYLAERGADLERPNHAGGTCLINAVHSPRLTEFLLQRRVDPNATDCYGRTALHYACRERRLDAVRLLLAAGADPYVRCRAGLDSVMHAALAGARRVVAALETHYSGKALADALIVLAASMVEAHPGAAVAAWSRAIRLYGRDFPEPVEEQRSSCAAWLAGSQEPTCDRELRALRRRPGAFRLPALLIVARVLGEQHPETSARIMRAGASMVSGGRPREAVGLLAWALRARLAAGTLLHEDSATTLVALTGLLIDCCLGNREDPMQNRLPPYPDRPSFEELFSIFQLIADNISDAQIAVTMRPTCRRQMASFDAALRCTTHLLHLMLRLLEEQQATASDFRRLRLMRSLALLLRHSPCSVRTGDSLLHLSVSRLNVLRPSRPLFPCALTARALLEAGAPPGMRNCAGGSALLTATAPRNYDTAVLDTLMAGGAHLDQPNSHGDTPAALLAARRSPPVLPLLRLTCLAATVAARLPPPSAGDLPRGLVVFLNLHRS